MADNISTSCDMNAECGRDSMLVSVTPVYQSLGADNNRQTATL